MTCARPTPTTYAARVSEGMGDGPLGVPRPMGLFSRRTADTTVPDDLPPADITTITDDTFMSATEGGWTIVDFWADWCGPCHQFAPTFEHAARRHGDRIRFAKLDVESARQAAGLVGVQSIPTVVVFGPDGSEVTRATGVLRPADLERLISEVDRVAGQA